MELKELLRLQAKGLRVEMTDEQRRMQSNAIFETLINSPLFNEADCLLTYISLPTEPDTIQLVSHAFQLGIPVAAPVILNRTMRFMYLENLNQLTPGPLGILQPLGQAQPLLTPHTLCVVPGLLFDHRGHRVGYGGGHYDRFLSDFPGLTVGFCFSDFLSDEIPHDSWDLPVDWIALPGQLIKTKS